MFEKLRPYIFKFSPEIAHSLAINALKLSYIKKKVPKIDSSLSVKLFDKTICSPVGIAAGFDKNAEVYNSLFNLGFGFVEVGTITPKKQYGNPKPRVFRLEEDYALINRLGFNNTGSNEICRRIKNNRPNGFLGINIGPNKDTKEKSGDYITCLRKFYNLGDYITINISSPNTENLRLFHEENELENLLKLINEEKNKLNTKIPIAVKVSPDLNLDKVQKFSEILIQNSVDLIVVSNTTDRNRNGLKNINKLEKGGLSGKPLEKITNNLIRKFYKVLGKKIIIIGVGGTDSAEGVFNKILSGATLVQIYTGMVYKGPNIALQINNGLSEILKKEGYKNISDVIGKFKT